MNQNNFSGHVFSTMEIKMIKAYLKLSSSIGVANVTLKKVSDEADVAFGTVRYHFADDNLSLTEATVLYIIQSGYRYIEDYISHASKNKKSNGIEEYINANFNWIENYWEQAHFLIYFYYLNAGNAPLKVKNRDLFMRAKERILSLLHQSVGKETIPAVNKGAELVGEIHALVVGHAISALTDGKSESLKLHRELCLKTAKKLLQLYAKKS